MSNESFDISGITRLEHLIEEARHSGKLVLLRRGEEVVAEITPVAQKPVRPVKPRTPEGREAFQRAAGSWEDLDVEAFLNDVRNSRRITVKSPVDL